MLCGGNGGDGGGSGDEEYSVSGEKQPRNNQLSNTQAQARARALKQVTLLNNIAVGRGARKMIAARAR